MNHNETEIPIIGGYERLEYTVDGGWMVQIPSQKLLEELIRFPKIDNRYPDPSDPFNVDYYRIRDRDEDLNNQLLLQSRSNWIVSSISRELLSPSPLDRAIYSYCIKHDICFESVYYRLNLIKYCQKILPGAGTNPDKNSKLITAFAGVKPESRSKEYRTYDFNDFTEAALRNGKGKYFDKLDSSFKTRIRRFSEFREAVKFLDVLSARPSFDDELHEIILDQSRELNKNHRKRKQQRTKDRKSQKSQLTKDSNNTSLDYRILTQCLFCNRFHLQEPTPELSRSCNRDKCKLKKEAWWQSIKNGKGIDIDRDTISPSGF
jgi:hypothetical protein